MSVNFNTFNFQMEFQNQWQFLQFGWHRFTVEQRQPPLVSPRPPGVKENEPEISDKVY